METANKKFKSELCEKTFNQKDSLFVNKQSHARKKTFKCKLCEMAFSNNFHLNTHMLRHWREAIQVYVV